MRRLVGLVVLVLGLSVLAGLQSAVAQVEPAPCEVLGASDVRYTSAPQTGIVEPGVEQCFVLPDGAGTVYHLAANMDDVALSAFEVRDADDVKLCEGGSTCRLTGNAPFRFRMAVTYTAAYELQILRVTGDHRCQPVAMQDFGAAQEVTARLDGNLVNCFGFRLPAGAALMFNSGFTSQPYVRMYDAQGAEVCISRFPECVDVADEARDVVLIAQRIVGIFDPLSGRYRFTLGNLTGTDGCHPTMDTRWTASATSRTARSSTQIDCWLLPTAEGEPVTFATGSSATARDPILLAADGRLACNDTLLACRPSGPTPYRAIVATTYSTYANQVQPSSYRTAVRSLTPGSGCPVITPRPYGTPATDRETGNGCRQFDVLPGHDYFAAPVNPRTGQRTYGAVLGNNLQTPPPGDGCFPTNPVCADLDPGRYFLISDVLGADTVTAFHDLADPRGCESLAPDLSDASGPQALAAVDCYQLLSAPGDFVDVLSTATATSSDEGYRIVNALGDDACDFTDFTGYCKLVGPPPYRLLVGSGSAENYVVGLVDMEDPPDCVPIDLGPRSGKVVQFDASDRIECFTAATGGAQGVEAVHMQRLLGNGGAILTNYPNGACQHPSWYPTPITYAQAATFVCERPVPGEGYSFVVVGDGTNQAYYVQRAENSADPANSSLTGMYIRVLPEVKGTPRMGSRLRAVPGTWDPGYPQVRYRYQWMVNDRAIPGATDQRLVIRKRFVGKSVRVMVTAVAPSFRSGFAFSPSRKVRR